MTYILLNVMGTILILLSFLNHNPFISVVALFVGLFNIFSNLEPRSSKDEKIEEKTP